MSKRVYFCFHYQDVIDFRANVVRNHWLLKDSREEAGFYDASIWEKSKKQGDIALKRLINSELENTSVSCVLIGSDTYQRPWVKYEIFRSIYKNNKIIGVHINGIKDKNQRTKIKGKNPFEDIGVKFNENSSKYAFAEKKGDGQWYYWEEINKCRWFSNDYFKREFDNQIVSLSSYFPVYDWINDNGYHNFSSWVW